MQRHARQVKQELERAFAKWYVRRECMLTQLLLEDLKLESSLIRSVIVRLAALVAVRNQSEGKTLHAGVHVNLENFELPHDENTELDLLTNICHTQRCELQAMAIEQDSGEMDPHDIYEALLKSDSRVFVQAFHDDIFACLGTASKSKKARMQTLKLTQKESLNWFLQVLTPKLVTRDLKISFESMSNDSKVLTASMLGTLFEKSGLSSPSAEDLELMISDTNGAVHFDDVLLFMLENGAISE